MFKQCSIKESLQWGEMLGIASDFAGAKIDFRFYEPQKGMI